MAYAMQVENMSSSSEVKQFDRELEAAPGRPVSYGTADLMRAMMMPTVDIPGIPGS